VLNGKFISLAWQNKKQKLVVLMLIFLGIKGFDCELLNFYALPVIIHTKLITVTQFH